MESWRRELLDRLERSGYIPIIRELTKAHTCPFFWYDDNRQLGCSVLHNGTITLIDSGETTFAVSAHHVYTAYLRDKQEIPTIKCQFGSVTVEPENLILSENSGLDLVTFRLSPVIAAATGARAHNAPVWPPRALAQSDLVIIGGYPGIGRAEKSSSLDTDFVTFISRISQSSDDHASIYLNIPESHWPVGRRLYDGPDLGGASGGPVFRYLTEPIEMLEIAGIIYESNQIFELVFARHANRILANGVIR